MPYVASGIAYRAVRNSGPIGGSLAHADPAADWISTTAALGATLVSQGADGTKRRLSADTFLVGAFQTRLGANEVLIAIETPRLSVRARWGYYKIWPEGAIRPHEFIRVSLSTFPLPLERIATTPARSPTDWY